MGIAGTAVQLPQKLVADTFTSKAEKTTGGFSGIVAFLEKLLADVEKDSTEVQTQGRHCQKHVAEFMTESSASRPDTAKKMCDSMAQQLSSVFGVDGLEGARVAPPGMQARIPFSPPPSKGRLFAMSKRNFVT